VDFQALDLHGGNASVSSASHGALLLALARAKRWQMALQMLGEAIGKWRCRGCFTTFFRVSTIGKW